MNKTRKLTLIGISTAVVALVTMYVNIKILPTSAGTNLGDSIILVISTLFDSTASFGIGAIGSILADILLGSFVYVPATFIAKGGEAFIAHYLYKKTNSIFSFVPATLWMVFIYFINKWILKNSFEVALIGILPNLLQAFISVLIASIIVKSSKNPLKNLRKS